MTVCLTVAVEAPFRPSHTGWCASTAAVSADDAILVARTLAGDRSAFEALVATHLRRAQALARVVVRDGAAIDDVVQESFIRAYDRLGSLSEPAHFPTWLGTIVRNESVTWLRRNARRGQSLESAHLVAPELTIDSETDARILRLRAAMTGLSATYREILALKYEADLDYQAIADTLGLSVANVEKKLYRARQALLEKMKE